MNGSQESGIFHEGTEVESMTSNMGIIFVKIQFHFEAYSRSKNGEGR